ncbi:hypothetical protein ACN42_g988 [Penicillium freii]|uniref:Uncharacterized protein n=1 Tax=Penicillium freii TaxID=48697 RepID=A0A117NRU6_PENFR|nr:hypothetical protein ACN42_g988 [Penicillium freii]
MVVCMAEIVDALRVAHKVNYWRHILHRDSSSAQIHWTFPAHSTPIDTRDAKVSDGEWKASCRYSFQMLGCYSWEAGPEGRMAGFRCHRAYRVFAR